MSNDSNIHLENPNTFSFDANNNYSNFKNAQPGDSQVSGNIDSGNKNHIQAFSFMDGSVKNSYTQNSISQ